MATKIIKVPDIGADSAEVVEILVAAGDLVDVDQSLVVLESDKASMEVPCPEAGIITVIKVAVGDQLSQDMDLVELELSIAVDEAAQLDEPVSLEPGVESELDVSVDQASEVQVGDSQNIEPVDLLVPDMGADSAEVIEVSVAVGDLVEEGDTLVVAETDKASVEVPAESAGEVTAVHVETGNSIAQGDKLVTLLTTSATDSVPPLAPAPSEPQKSSDAETIKPAAGSSEVKETVSSSQSNSQPQPASLSEDVHAGPAVRKLARELGVELAEVKATGERNRILKDDVHAYVKQQLQAPKTTASGGTGIPQIPTVDWSQFGDIETQAMSRINKVTAENMSRNWLNVPHVTQFDNADVTELETYRGYLKPEGVARGIKMTPLAFLLRASAIALKEHPKFNTALHSNGTDLVQRKFFHVGIAVDTPIGLMVPVIRDVDQKDIWQLASEVSTLAGKAKGGKLSPKEMQGASFTISSLGAIGGTGFTPIVPAPQVGILGAAKTSIQPVWDGHAFAPRKMMPLSLSYDHRVVNGADAGKFMTTLVEVLGDLDRIWNG